MLGKPYTSEFLIPCKERGFFLSKEKREIGVERKRGEGNIRKRRGISSGSLISNKCTILMQDVNNRRN